MDRINKDVGAGALFFATGAFFALHAWSHLAIGSMFRMGPGLFPVLVGTLLAVIGLAVLARGLGTGASDFGPVPWRAIVLISVSILAFAVLVRPLGMVVSLFVTSLLAAYGSRKMTLRYALIVAIVMTLFCTTLFGFVLELSVPLVGDLFRS